MKIKVKNKDIKSHWLPHSRRVIDIYDEFIDIGVEDAKQLISNNPQNFAYYIEDKKFDKLTWNNKYKQLLFQTDTSSVNGFGYSGAKLLIELNNQLDVYNYNSNINVFDKDPKLLKISEKKLTNFNGIGINYNTPGFEKDNLPSSIKGIFSMYETTGLKKEWVNNINSYDFCLVPSKFLVKVFKNNGVKIPIYLVPLGVDSLDYPFYKRKIKEKDDIFTFGIYANLTIRKGADIAVRAFLKAFPKNQFPNIRLHIKTTTPVNWMQIKLWDSKNDNRIIETWDKLTREGLNNLLHTWDCLVYPSHGEGFGLCPIESMSTGLTCIITNWGGMKDFINKDISYPLDYELEDAWGFDPNIPLFKKGGENYGQFAKPNEDHLIELLRYVYTHRQEALNKGIKASEYVKEYWNWTKSCSKLINSIDNYLKKKSN